MLTSLISWGLSLIFSGLLVREMTRRVKGMDYRAAGAAAYLGLGAVWALGLSSSAAMLMATKSCDSAVAVRHQRTDPADANAFPLAEHAHGRGPDRGLGAGRLPLRAVGRKRPHGG